MSINHMLSAATPLSFPWKQCCTFTQGAKGKARKTKKKGHLFPQERTDFSGLDTMLKICAVCGSCQVPSTTDNSFSIKGTNSLKSNDKNPHLRHIDLHQIRNVLKERRKKLNFVHHISSFCFHTVSRIFSAYLSLRQTQLSTSKVVTICCWRNSDAWCVSLVIRQNQQVL